CSRPGAADRQSCRQGSETIAQGVRLAARAGATCRQGADAQILARRTVGRSYRCPIPAGLCAAAATEDRSRSRTTTIRADGNRDRVSPASARARAAISVVLLGREGPDAI